LQEMRVQNRTCITILFEENEGGRHLHS